MGHSDKNPSAKPGIEAQHAYYSDRWASFKYANELELTRIAAALQYMTQIEFPPNPKICDFGCGAGWSTNILGMFGQATWSGSIGHDGRASPIPALSVHIGKHLGGGLAIS